ncbi:zinc-binding dehydrogenase, partial [Williamsia sp.]|uniref:zinc-binding dehydrogenase n=1 Tax=Williamsia sp. TaxID=1872085 RepID=UPI002F929C85
ATASNICEMLAFHGGSAHGGGLSEFTVVEQDMAHRLPDSVSLESGALVEPMAVAQHAVNRVPLNTDDTVVVLGSGPIGIGVWFALRASNIERLIVSDPSAHRREAMAALGAQHIIDPTTQNLRETVDRLSGGRGAAVVFDAAGVPAAFNQGLSVLAPRGTLMVVGVHEKAFDFNPTALLAGEYTVTSSMTYTDDEFAQVIENMAGGWYSTDGWVEHRPLDGLVDSLDLLRTGRAMKILIDL